MMKARRITAVALTALLAAACYSTPPPDPVQTLRYRMPEDPPSLDPFRTGDENSNVYHYPIFDGLVEYEPGSLEVQPAVAESWTLSSDGLTYTFRLRRGVRFHNGRDVTAEDVVYSIRRALSAKDLSQKVYFYEAVQDVAAPDDGTVVITLSYPYEKFLTVLASEAGAILPREIYEDPAQGYLKHPVGCGPFQFESWEPRVSLTLSRFTGHWKGAAAPGALGKIVFRFIPDSTTAFEEYRRGGVDFTQEIPPGQRNRVREEMAADLHNWTRLSIFFVGFNHAAPPLKGNPKLRRAIVHAIDREYIVRVLQEGKDVVAAGVIPPGMLGHDPGRAAPAYDPNLAARLLAEAGYPNGKGLPELIYLSNETRGFRHIAERVLSDLGRVGVKVRIQMSDFNAFLGALQSFKADGASGAMFRMTWYADWPDPDNFLAAQFATGAQGNFGHYSNPRFDQMMEQARREPDGSKRADLYRQAETMLIEDGGLVPIYWYGQDVLLKPEFTGLKPNPLGTFGIAWEEVRRKP